MEDFKTATKYMIASAIFAAVFGIAAIVCAANKWEMAAWIGFAMAHSGITVCTVLLGITFSGEHTSFYGESIDDDDDDDEEISG